MSTYSTIQQHEPLRVPAGWTGQEKQLIVQLEEILDDLYSRFNRLKLTDLGKTLRKTITDTSEGVIHNTEDIEAARQEIIDKANDLITAYTVDIQKAVEGLSSTVAATYSAKTDTAELQEILQTSISQNAQDITAVASDVATIVDEFGNKVEMALQTWVRFDADGIHLGKQGSPFSVLLSNNRLSFQQDGSEIAYVSNNQLYIANASVTEQMKVGDFIIRDIGTAFVIK